MKILILNWRDIRNPYSGGAEILTHEIAKRLVVFGNKVVLFSSHFKGAKKEEIVDGVTIIRQGNPDVRSLFFSVQFKAFLFYKRKKKKFDLVIDEIHGVPFFTPLYVTDKKIVLICEVVGSLWSRIFGSLWGSMGLLAEIFYIRVIYRNIPYLTISESTKHELLKNGVKEKDIVVLPMGVNVPQNTKSANKEKEMTLIFIARLTKAKGIEDALFALKEILMKKKKVKLWIVGRGEDVYVKQLGNICKKLNISDNVTFFGYVSEEEKFSLLSRAHVLIHPSYLEGFGLTIPEAGFVGTPVIAYNSAGLRDIVKDGINGILLSENSPTKLASEALRVMQDVDFYTKLCIGAKKEAKQYNWDITARVVLNRIKKLLS